MEVSSLIQSLQETLSGTLPSLMAALGILVIGWFVAVLLRAGTRRLLGMLKLNERIQASTDGAVNAESWGATGVFWVVMFFVLIAFFNVLDLEIVSSPLQALVTRIFEYGPSLIAGLVLGLVAWIIASIARTLVTSGLATTTLDEKVSQAAEMKPISQNIGDVLYWLILLMFLPAILGTLQLEGLLTPVQGMVDKILAMVPNILAAAAITIVGWFVAKILRDLVQNLLEVVGFDKLGEKAGLTGKVGLSRLTAMIVFIFIFVPALVGALNTLQIEAISRPATEMLSAFMAAIPDIFAAAIILTIAFFLARFISGLLTTILAGVGANELPQKMGLKHVAKDGFSIAKLVGQVVSIFIMLFASVEAANQLGFAQISELVTMLIGFAGQVLLGSVILVAGFWLANMAYSAIIRVGGKAASTMASILRVAILGLVLAMGLRAMGIADDIVNMAFGLILGSVAVAFAVSFGLGGREAAGKQMEYWLANFRKD